MAHADLSQSSPSPPLCRITHPKQDSRLILSPPDPHPSAPPTGTPALLQKAQPPSSRARPQPGPSSEHSEAFSLSQPALTSMVQPGWQPEDEWLDATAAGTGPLCSSRAPPTSCRHLGVSPYGSSVSQWTPEIKGGFLKMQGTSWLPVQ